MMKQQIDLVAGVVAAYVAHNNLRIADLPALIGDLNNAFGNLLTPSAAPPESVKSAPAVSVRKSLGQDALICLDCGKSFKSLRRHLQSEHGINPDEYRCKFSLSAEYPMVAPAYAATRSKLAKARGFGLKKISPIV
jgi:predicted transcriptional regulator